MSKSNELTTTTEMVILERIQRFGINGKVAQDFAAAVVEDLRERLGGDEYYIPRPSARAAALRDFNGRNHDAVCRKHGVARRTLREWVRAAQLEGADPE